MKTKSYDVFISYRREGGQETAVLFYERLTQLGYRVAYDIESLRSGVFDEQILEIIRSCKDVVVVLGPGALDRCANPDDWVRQEVACALAARKNVVPLLLRGFTFPPAEDLPEDMRELSRYNGVGASMEHFDSTFERVRGRLTAHPLGRLMRRITWVTIAAVLGLGALTCTVFRDRVFPYPLTAADRQDFSAVLRSVVKQASLFESLVSAQDDFYEVAENAVRADSDASFANAYGMFKHVVDRIHPKEMRSDEAFLQTVGRAHVDRGDFASLADLMEMDYREALVDADVIRQRFKGRHDGGRSAVADLLEHIQIHRKIVHLNAEYYAVAMSSLFREISPNALREFRAESVPDMPMLSSYLGGEWLRDEAAIKQRLEMILRRIESETQKLFTQAGRLSDEVSRVSAGIKEEHLRRGIDEKRVDDLLEHIGELSSLETRVEDTKLQVEEKKAELYAKFAPKKTDRPEMLWGKVLRFLSVNMTEAALETIAVLRSKSSAEFPPDVCTAAEAFVSARGRLPFISGVMVAFFESPATSHAIFRPGDIIVEQDGKAVHFFNDCRMKDGSSYVVHRYDGHGGFTRLTLTMPPGQPRVATVDLMESAAQNSKED